MKKEVKHFWIVTITNCIVMASYAALFALIFNQVFIKESQSDRRERKAQENKIWIMEQELHSKKLEKHRQKMRERRESRQAEATASESVNVSPPKIAPALPEEVEPPTAEGIFLEERFELALNENAFREQMMALVSEEYRTLWEQVESDAIDYRKSLDETSREILDFYVSEAVKSTIESASEKRSEEDRLFLEALFNDPDMKAPIEIGVIPLMYGREQVIANKEAAQARLEKAKTELEAFERERESRIQPEEKVLRLIEEYLFSEP